MRICEKSVIFKLLKFNIIHNVHMTKISTKHSVKQDNNLFPENYSSHKRSIILKNGRKIS